MCGRVTWGILGSNHLASVQEKYSKYMLTDFAYHWLLKMIKRKKSIDHQKQLLTEARKGKEHWGSRMDLRIDFRDNFWSALIQKFKFIEIPEQQFERKSWAPAGSWQRASSWWPVCALLQPGSKRIGNSNDCGFTTFWQKGLESSPWRRSGIPQSDDSDCLLVTQSIQCTDNSPLSVSKGQQQNC